MRYLIAQATLALLLFTACNTDDDAGMPTPEESNSVVDFVDRNSDFSLFVAAVDATDFRATLAGEEELTVFAPNNAAFTAFLEDNNYTGVEAIPQDTLRELIANHLVLDNLESENLSSGYFSTEATAGYTDKKLSLYSTNENNLVLNGQAQAIETDIMASNGVIHTIDAVLTLPDIYSHLEANPELNSMTELVLASGNEETDFLDILSSHVDVPLTVFAPENDAFITLFSELGVENLEALDAGFLPTIMEMHLLSGAVYQEDMETGTVQTFGGEITVDAEAGTLTDSNGRIATFITTDIQGTNGIIHRIDTVLLPGL